MKFSDLLFRATLALYPRAFRKRFGLEMRRVFAMRAAHRPIIETLAELTDMLTGAPGMYLREWQRRMALRSTPAALLEARALQERPLRTERMMARIYDLRIALRTLLRRPGFSLVATATLALGIGMNTAVFGLVHAMLLRPLPYPDAGRLAAIWETSEGTLNTVSPVNFLDFREQARSFERMSAYNEGSYVLAGPASPRMVDGASVTPGFFQVLGGVPEIGRVFLPEEEDPGRPATAVVSHGFWQGTLGGTEDILERTVVLDGIAYRVVGVMPAGFEFPSQAELWVPFTMGPETVEGQRGAHYLNAVGRLRPGVRIEEAASELGEIAERLADTFPSSNFGFSATAISLREQLIGDVRPALLLLMGAVGAILLIACSNLANLFLSRAVTRSREFEVRRSLGARPRDLVWTVFSEGLVLSAFGGAAAIGVALLTLGLSRTLWEPALPELGGVGVGPAVLVFTLGITLLAGGLFGILPAMRVSLSEGRAGTAGATGVRVSADRSGRRARGALVVLQVILSVVLLAGAGLLLRSMDMLNRVDPGFDPENLLTFEVSLPEARYEDKDPQQEAVFFERLVERIEALPGVESAGAAFGLPFAGFSYWISVDNVDGVTPATPADEQSVSVRIVTPGYFETMRIPLLSGRTFSDTDRYGSEPVIIVNDEAARYLWGDADPIDRHLQIGTTFGLGRGRAGGRVIGVVGGVHQNSLRREPSEEVFLVQDQFPFDYMGVALRTSSAGTVLVPAIRDIVADLDPTIPIFSVRMMEDLIADSIRQPRLYTVLLVIFALLALTIATVGIYGVLSFSTARRAREIGIRMAVGARSGEVVRMVVGEGMRLVIFGVVLGLVGAAAGSALLARFLFGVAPLDPVSYLAGALLLSGVAVFACWIPALSVTRVDPVEVLRSE